MRTAFMRIQDRHCMIELCTLLMAIINPDQVTTLR